MPDVRAPESAGMAIEYIASSASRSAGEASVEKAISVAMRPAMHMNVTIARCLPKRMAASLPMMLDGMARTAESRELTFELRDNRSTGESIAVDYFPDRPIELRAQRSMMGFKIEKRDSHIGLTSGHAR